MHKRRQSLGITQSKQPIALNQQTNEKVIQDIVSRGRQLRSSKLSNDNLLSGKQGRIRSATPKSDRNRSVDSGKRDYSSSGRNKDQADLFEKKQINDSKKKKYEKQLNVLKKQRVKTEEQKLLANKGSKLTPKVDSLSQFQIYQSLNIHDENLSVFNIQVRKQDFIKLYHKFYMIAGSLLSHFKSSSSSILAYSSYQDQFKSGYTYSRVKRIYNSLKGMITQADSSKFQENYKKNHLRYVNKTEALGTSFSYKNQLLKVHMRVKDKGQECAFQEDLNQQRQQYVQDSPHISILCYGKKRTKQVDDEFGELFDNHDQTSGADYIQLNRIISRLSLNSFNQS